MADSYALMLKKEEFALDKLQVLKEHQCVQLHEVKNKILEHETKIAEIDEAIDMKKKQIEWVKQKLNEGKIEPEEGQ